MVEGECNATINSDSRLYALLSLLIRHEDTLTHLRRSRKEGINMKSCPNCGELLGDRVEQCFNCNYSFTLRRVITKEEITEKRRREDAAREEAIRRDEENRIKAERERALQEKRKAEFEKRKSDFLETTGFDFHNHNITRYCGIVTSDIAMGTGPLTELSAAVSDFTGTTSGAFERKISTAKHQAIQIMKNKALNMGANGLIGVKVDLEVTRENMFLISGTATAVVVDYED